MHIFNTFWSFHGRIVRWVKGGHEVIFSGNSLKLVEKSVDLFSKLASQFEKSGGFTFKVFLIDLFK